MIRLAPIALTSRNFALAAVALALLAGGGLERAEAANGFALAGQATQSAGRGGGSAAVFDGALSGSTNPALISLTDELRFDGTLIWFSERVRERTEFEDTLDENLVGFPFPIVSVAWDPFGQHIDLDGNDTYVPSDWRFALSLYQPVTAVFAPTFTVSWQVTDTVSVGAAVNLLLTYISIDTDGSVGGGGGSGVNDFVPDGLVFEHFEADGTPIVPPRPFTAGTSEQISWAELFELVNNPAQTGPDPDSSDNASTNLKLKDVFGFGVAGQFGVLWQPRDDLHIGVGVRTPGIVFNPRGKAEIDLDDAIRELQEDPTVGLVIGALLDTFVPDQGRNGFDAEYDVTSDDLILPPSVSIGAAFWPMPWWLLTVNFEFVGWDRAFDKIEVEAEGGRNNDINEVTGGSEVDYTFTLNWKNQFGFSVGTAVGVSDWLVLRAGFSRLTGQVPKETQTASSLAIENHAAGGASVYLDNWDFHLAYVYGLPIEKKLDSSTFKAEQHLLYFGVGYSY